MAKRRRKTHCIRGHARTPDNLWANDACKKCAYERRGEERKKRRKQKLSRVSKEQRLAEKRVATALKAYEQRSGEEWTQEHRIWVERRLREREGLPLRDDMLTQITAQLEDLSTTPTEIEPKSIR